MKPYKVLIVDDSAFMRKMISDIVQQSERLEVVGTARDGVDGLKKLKDLKPDVVTLDVEMPKMNGLETLERIMKSHPMPVVMLSSTTKSGAKETIEALRIGAIDFISKPSGPISLDIHKVASEITEKIIQAAETSSGQQYQHLRKKFDINNNEHIPPFIHKQTVVCIGVSTGGPKALQQVITQLPNDFHAPVVIVQHMPAKFTKSLAERLDELSAVKVKEAIPGEILRNGVVYIAPGDYHLQLKQLNRSLVIDINREEPEKGHRPSVNKLFSSVATLKNTNKLAVVLTGMGTDGTDGAMELKQLDTRSIIIAESQETALIYGMPKSIVEHINGCLIRRLDEITSTLVELVNE
ncbi:MULTISPECIES: protein-glutamate methylesterase/protein-glutamine glutaminase [Allobacillus]|uniref:Protein-glutamate methylesterase/protein-glutamine glutaminase n=1 Tax=Allobacillus halotolerans TaxID=570278 RepID=A0ABS6GQ20_9BACI|nr:MULTISPECIES: chemotaxis response regulator protein-glutamate methylesterase [Allobacillus]MBU6081055.1 chemotaxis response regulator protein-glutamate methylesterase [Allobacillus halotolerans]TSJ69208.1 chemotaxis response regulator protein-glutamate methylesterase [Allobacillus sp. SKP2-8]